MSKRQRILISWGAVLGWMALIFYFSSQLGTASGEMSMGITAQLALFIKKLLNITTIDLEVMNHLVRKAAHFFEYMVLGLLVINACRLSWKQRHFWLLASVIAVLYAASDEFHQLFVAGRGPQVRDVLLDSCGALFGIGLYLLVVGLKNKKHNQ